MEFGKHGTFYIRNGWISKGINIIEDEGKRAIFSPKNMEYAIDCLGIGKAMVASLRYWLDVLRITYEDRENSEVIKKFTAFGEFIKNNDRYLERKGTLWLLHYKLATAKESATTWYWFFNVFNYNEFDDKIFIQRLEDYVQQNCNKKISVNTLKKDYLCLKRTYLFENYSNQNINIEEMTSSPLKELKLITVSANSNMYIKNKGNINEIAPEIFYYVIVKSLEDEIRQISIEDLAYKEFFPGKIFNLSINDVFEMLNILESKNYVKINRKYGDNHIEILERDIEKILNNYYSNTKLD